MKFLFAAEEAQQPAGHVAKYLKRAGMKVRPEVAAWPDAPYRTTLVGTRAGLTLLVEAQGVPKYGKSLKELALWLAARRLYAELYLATMADAHLELGLLEEVKKDGVGLFIVKDSGEVLPSHKAKNFALIVTPDPTLRFGDCRVEVSEAVRKFNEVDRKDGLRDMCELVERETQDLALLAVRKGWLTLSEASVHAKDWSDQINMLSSKACHQQGKDPLISSSFKDDLHSFRGARNLVDHKVMSKREDSRRQKQFAERMMQGPRLIAEFASIRRRLR